MLSGQKTALGMGIATVSMGVLGYVLWPSEDIAVPTTIKIEESPGITSTSQTTEKIERIPPGEEQPEVQVLTPEEAEQKYAAYQVQGFVHRNNRPLQNVVIEA